MNDALITASLTIAILVSAAFLLTGRASPPEPKAEVQTLLELCQSASNGGDYQFKYIVAGGSSRSECLQRADVDKELENPKIQG